MNEEIIADVLKQAVVRALQDAQHVLRARVLPDTAAIAIRQNFAKRNLTVLVEVDVDPREVY